MANSDEPRGLIARISTLLNSEVCSDVVFHVKHNGEQSIFYAHTAILIVAGNGFPDLLKQTSQPKVIKIFDFSAHIVKMMLTYLYTDELSILSMENAADLYKLAHMYCINDLEKICSNYITKEEVNIDNLFVKYESALSCNFPKLLEKCRNLVQSETKAVFDSRYFGEAPYAVVEDIFSLDQLNVSSEFDVIKAGFRWSACECRRKGRPTEKLCMRDAIDSLLKHLRFLSLSADEFCDFAGKDDNIFTTFETALLTRKILQPDYKGEFPTYLCSISKPRQPKSSNHLPEMNNFKSFYSEAVKKNTFKDVYSVPAPKSSFKDPYSEPIPKNSFKDLYSEPDNSFAVKGIYYETNKNSTVESPTSKSVPKYNLNSCFSEPGFRNSFQVLNNFQSQSSNGSSSPETVNSFKLVQEDTLFSRPSLDKRPPALSKVEQKPLLQYNQKKSTPMLKVMPQAQPVKRTFDFPLQEMKKGIGFASMQDIKCNAKIQMQTGAIFIHGVELKIAEQKLNTDESFEVFSLISNNCMSKDETFSLKLKNSMLSLIYSEPVKVSAGNLTDIEITIEDLHLNRCFVCHGQTYELNCELNVMAEISVKSTRSKSQDTILYLINRIIYSNA